MVGKNSSYQGCCCLLLFRNSLQGLGRLTSPMEKG
jgi:hypothetical protein